MMRLACKEVKKSQTPMISFYGEVMKYTLRNDKYNDGYHITALASATNRFFFAVRNVN